MLYFLRYLKFSFRTIIILFIKGFLLLIPKKKNLIVFSSWFGQKYIDNPKYFFEYMLNNHSDNYEICWLTRNHEVYYQLKQKKYPVKYLNKISGLWTQIRAKYLVGCIQISDYRQYFLCKCIILDLNHGHPIKDPGVIVRDKLSQISQKVFMIFVNYYTITSSDFAKTVHKEVMPVKDSHIFVSNFPRNDFFHNPKIIQNVKVEEIRNGRKSIVYMPTHRSEGRVSMNVNYNLDIEYINSLCEERNMVFFIKKHFYHRKENEEFLGYNNIFDLSSYDLDPQELLFQADILISDYSACYIDYLLLDRPIIFYHYDIEQFQLTERSFYLPFNKELAATRIFNKSELNTFLEKVTLTWNDYLQDERINFRKRYFSSDISESGCKQAFDILKSI